MVEVTPPYARTRTMCTYSIAGHATSAVPVFGLRLDTDLFGIKTDEIFVWSTDFAGFRTRLIAVPLTPEQTELALASRRVNHAPLDLPLVAVLPSQEEQRVYPDAYGVAFGKILLLRVDDAGSRSARELLEDCVERVGEPATYFAPTLAWNLAILGGGLGGDATLNLTAFWFHNQPVSPSAAARLPESVLKLIELITLPSMFQAIRRRVARLDVAYDVPEYLSTFAGDNVAATYIKKHLNHRQRLLAVTLPAGESTEQLAAALETNTMRVAAHSPGTTVIDGLALKGYHDYEPLRYLERCATSGAEKARISVARITTRDALIADYLRDRTNAILARSNIKLQHAVLALAIATLFVGALGLIQGFLPDATKALVWEKLRGFLGTLPRK
jgi:hypothetical protein